MLRIIIRATIIVLLVSSILMFMYEPTTIVFGGMVLLWTCALVLTPKRYGGVKKPVSKDDTDDITLTLTHYPKDLMERLNRNPTLNCKPVPLKVIALAKSVTMVDVYDRLFTTGAPSE